MTDKKLTRDMKTPCQTAVGRILRNYRCALGLPTTLLAEYWGITKEKIASTETGNRVDDAHKLIAKLTEIEETPGLVDKLIREHKQRKLAVNPYYGRTVKDAFHAIVEIDKRLNHLEDQLGVTTNDENE